MKKTCNNHSLTTAFSSLSETMPPLERLEVEDDTTNPIKKKKSF